MQQIGCAAPLYEYVYECVSSNFSASTLDDDNHKHSSVATTIHKSHYNQTPIAIASVMVSEATVDCFRYKQPSNKPLDRRLYVEESIVTHHSSI